MPVLIGKYPAAQRFVLIPTGSALQPLPTSQGQNGITYNLGEDGKITIDMWILFYELPTYQSSTALYDVRYIFQRAIENVLVDEGKIAQLHAGINYEGRMVLFIDRRVGSLGGGANPLSGGGVHDQSITPVLKDSGSNFRYDYVTAAGDTVASAAFDNAQTQSYSNHAVWALSPKNTVTHSTLYHLTFMLTGKRMKMFKDGTSVADFMSPLNSTAFNSNQLNFISTSWFLGAGHPAAGGYQPTPLIRSALAGWRVWNGFLEDNQIPMLMNLPFDQYAELKNSANDTVKVVSSYAFDLFPDDTSDNNDYGAADNSCSVSGLFTKSDIPVPTANLSQLRVLIPYAPVVSTPIVPR